MFLLARYGGVDPATASDVRRIGGLVTAGAGDRLYVDWTPVGGPDAPLAEAPAIAGLDVYKDYVGAALTSHAFDRVAPGLGKWLVALASWAPVATDVKLDIDWNALGIDPHRARIEAVPIEGFQPARTFAIGAAIPVEPGKGWLLRVQ